MINGASSSGTHHDMQNGLSNDMIRNTSNCHEDVLDPFELESRKRAQIERNNEWIEKMSPIVKYKIQEYVRKQRAKKMQRRKFSLACGLNNRMKQEPINHSTPSRRRSKKNGETSTKNRNDSGTMVPGPMLERNLSQPEMQDSRKSASVSNRRKSAPAEKMDMRDLDDLE